MKINRHNYEEYFILYLDNELGSDDRREVESFAGENPDLKAELDILLQSKLVPDTTITFENKESLFVRNSSSVNMNNYEEWLLSYIDNELTTEETKDIERFVAEHPSVKKELELFQKTKLHPEVIAFPDKESLYRKEEKAKVVAIRWWRIAAAAVLLIGISTATVVLINKKDKGDVANVQKKEVNPTDDTPVLPQQENAVPAIQKNIADNNPQKTETSIQQSGNPVATRKNKTVAKEKNIQAPEVTPKEGAIVKRDIEKKPDNNLPKPDFNPNIIGNPDPKQDEVITDAKISPEILTTPDKKTDIGAVTASAPEPSEDIEQPTGKKNKLRGFFRKITRTFEKRTNMKATGDDDDRLLIAGLSIKLN